VQRFPRSVFDVGDEPDPRFSLANERTFLAWLRSGMALMAAGVALHAVALPLSTAVRLVASLLLVALGIIASVNAWVTWCRAERAMRTGAPLPGLSVGFALMVGVVAAGLLVIAALLIT